MASEVNWQPIDTAPEGTTVLVWCGLYKDIYLAAKETDGKWYPVPDDDNQLYPEYWAERPDPPKAKP